MGPGLRRDDIVERALLPLHRWGNSVAADIDTIGFQPAGGQEGVAKAIDILAKELTTTMGPCGVNTIAEIDDHVLAV